MNFTEKEKILIKLLQGDFPLDKQPFLTLSKKLNMGEEEILQMVKEWQRQGILRRIGASLRHYRVGYEKNTLVLWAVPPARVDEVGKLFAEKKWVSHCYERQPPYLGRYNLFTMIHEQRQETEELAEIMAKESGIEDYLSLETLEELKKTSMAYF